MNSSSHRNDEPYQVLVGLLKTGVPGDFLKSISLLGEMTPRRRRSVFDKLSDFLLRGKEFLAYGEMVKVKAIFYSSDVLSWNALSFHEHFVGNMKTALFFNAIAMEKAKKNREFLVYTINHRLKLLIEMQLVEQINETLKFVARIERLHIDDERLHNDLIGVIEERFGQSSSLERSVIEQVRRKFGVRSVGD